MKSMICFLLLFLDISVITANRLEGKINIIFRFDDYKLTSNVFYDSLFYVFNKNHIPLCLGIIPYDKNGLIFNNLDQEQLNGLRLRIVKNEIEIALHGFNHNDNSLSKKSFLVRSVSSEFANLNYKDQFKKIKKAKIAIDSLLNSKVNIFIPPFNSYDDNTLKVLDSLKFDIISASIDGPSKSDKIKYIPYTINNLNELPKLLTKYQFDKTIVVMMHQYVFKEGTGYMNHFSPRIDFNQLDSTLNWINNNTNLSTTSFSMLSHSEDFGNKRFVLNSTNKNLIIKILYKLKLYRYGVYSTVEDIRNHRFILTLVNIIFHIISFVSIYFASNIITKFIKPFKVIMLLFSASMIIVILGILYKGIYSHYQITYLVFAAIISIAILLGIIRGFNKSI
jgi:peptidoglycan/xylan/chitin deacetylase (PgdA/CDA1 family)